MNRTILMLEHDDDDRYITQETFDENNAKVKINFVSTSHELFNALEKCKADRSPFPSLILLNYYASPLSSVEILRMLKSHDDYRYIPVIILSGTVRSDIVKQCYEEGASSFIQKPSLSSDTSVKIANFIHYWFETVEMI